MTITTYNIGDAFDDFLTEYISQAFGLAMAGADEEKLNELAIKIFTEKVEALSEKDYSETAGLALEKTEAGWIVSDIDDASDILNVLTGGMVKTMNETLENFE